MQNSVLSAILVLLAGPLGAHAAVPETPEVTAVSEPGEQSATPETGSERSKNAASSRSVDQELPDAFPWNPPVRQGDEWPYKTPLQAGIPDPAPWGDFWFEGEYLLWGIRGQQTPPLVTTSPPAFGGVLNSPATTVLFGGSRLADNPFSGGRFTIAAWVNDCHTAAFEGDYFFLGQRSARYNAASSGELSSPVLARPFHDAVTGSDDAFPVAFPGVLSGSIGISAPTFFQGADANFSYTTHRDCRYHVDLLGGFRYLQLDDKLNILSTTGGLLNGVPASLGIMDQFVTRTHFYGGQAGLRADYCWHQFVFGFKSLLALGYDADVINIAGSRVLNVAGAAPVSTAAGLLAQPSNSGDHTSHAIAAVSELDLRAGWQVQEQVQFYVGCTFLYWSDVVRPGDQIDLNVNLLQGQNGPLTGPAQPAFVARESVFWAYGLDVGVQIRY